MFYFGSLGPFNSYIMKSLWLYLLKTKTNKQTNKQLCILGP